MTTSQIAIDGMHCGGCVARVTAALKGVAGVSVDDVQVGFAKVHCDEHAVAPETLVASLEKLGFDVRLEPAATK